MLCGQQTVAVDIHQHRYTISYAVASINADRALFDRAKRVGGEPSLAGEAELFLRRA